MNLARRVVIVVSFLMATFPAFGAESMSYAYDAKGRLIRVSHSGSVNNGVQTTYAHDKAENRTNTTTTGSSNPTPQ